MIVIDSFPVFLAFHPHSFIDISIRVAHLATAFLQVVLPISFVDVSVEIVVSSPSLLPVLHNSFEALAVSEDVDSIYENVVFPASEVDVSMGVEIHTKTLSFMIAGV